MPRASVLVSIDEASSLPTEEVFPLREPDSRLKITCYHLCHMRLNLPFFWPPVLDTGQTRPRDLVLLSRYCRVLFCLFVWNLISAP